LQKIRRADLTIAISYDADIKKSERNNTAILKIQSASDSLLKFLKKLN
jgi:hypothetical protein